MELTSSFGARLKAAREARGVALRDVAATTKISAVALEALERDDPSRLPGGIFSRAFVRAYAAEVGLDPEATVREFAERFPDTVQPLRDMAHLAPAHETGGGGSWRRGAVAALVLVVALGAGVVMMGWTDGWDLSPSVPTDLPAVASAPPLVAAEPDLIPSPAPVRDAGAAAAALEAPTVAPTVRVPDVSRLVALGADEPMRLAIHAVGRCWVRVVVDGEVVLSRELSPGERAEHDASGEIVLTVGDAGAFAYSINDVPGRPLGASGKVVTIRIKRSNLTDFVAS